MDKLSIHNIQKVKLLESELEYERASSIYLQLRVLVKEDKSYQAIREHLRSLIKKYEQDNWANENSITDNQIKESDIAESLVKAENEFYYKRKVLIKAKLKLYDLNQNDLAKILGHRKGYMSELVNGLRPFSKEDIVVVNRLLKIKLVDLIPTFIKQDRAAHIKQTLNSLSNTKIKLSNTAFDLQFK
ncbi:helix-turn-helix transcriptional regulator [Cryomorpha ignava]|uniref:Helix-turn-helix transcriptional regulator n=1 Tax=Cryomorpha ignava TaxID=101383 RepID=A0A7K3WNK2_9FLAO|nr:helix-turn-helix transcriptional regulator [Cryomorpha ignava]NEN23233.1 helix-turn-helix transcriptional regulator [Cryomorpha ignava]